MIKSSLENDFGSDTAYKRHERGEIDSEEFFDDFQHPSGLFRTHNYLTGGTPSLSERCPASLNRWPRRREASAVRLYQFQPRTRAVLVKSVFRHSRQFQRGLRVVDDWVEKARAEAYDYVVRAIGVSADRIVFFDDTLENIEGARARGLQAVHVKSGADYRRAHCPD